MAKTTKKTGSLRMERAKAEIRMKDRAQKQRKLQQTIQSDKGRKASEKI